MFCLFFPLLENRDDMDVRYVCEILFTGLGGALLLAYITILIAVAVLIVFALLDIRREREYRKLFIKDMARMESKRVAILGATNDPDAAMYGALGMMHNCETCGREVVTTMVEHCSCGGKLKKTY